MKILIKNYKYMSMWGFFPIYLLILFFILKTDHCVAYGLPFSAGREGINYYAFRDWILMIVVPLVANCGLLNNMKTLENLICLRVKHRTHFCFLMISGCLINSILWGSIIAVLSPMLNHFEFQLKIVIAIAANQIVWGQLQVLFYCLCRSVSMSCLYTVGVVSSSFLIGEYHPNLAIYLPSTWGMIYRSNIYSKNGAPLHQYITYSLLLFAAAIFLSLLCYRKDRAIAWKK